MHNKCLKWQTLFIYHPDLSGWNPYDLDRKTLLQKGEIEHSGLFFIC
jgi:hypothetical protein